MPFRHTAVWIDHHEARVFHFTDDGFDESTIRVPHAHVHRHPKGSEDAKTHPDDRFFREVAQALVGAEEVLVLGPSTAKLQFLRYAHKHDPALDPKIVGVETVDHPTDPQIAAYAKRYFKAADRMH
jgi:stalled ribosome rescue protein Dom34